MKIKRIATSLTISGFAASLALTLMAPTIASARDEESKFNYSTGQWGVPKRAKNSWYASNRSPIAKRRVRIDSKYSEGTIIVDTSERRLYYVMSKGRAMKYGIGVGRDGFQWSGKHRVTRKAEWPGWTPPKTMIRRVKRETGKTLKSYYEGGPNNPLGARAMYIGSTIYRIHGTNQPWTIGKAMSSGCIRLANDDVTDLYSRVKVGSKVIVRN